MYGEVDSTRTLLLNGISFDPYGKFELSLTASTCQSLYRVMSNILRKKSQAGPKFVIYHICLQWQITPCLTDSSNAHGATFKVLRPGVIFRSIQQQFQLLPLRAIFVITFGRGALTGTIISVQDRPPPQTCLALPTSQYGN